VKRWKSANRDWSHYEDTLPLLAKSTIDQVSIETAASGVAVAVIEALGDKDVLLRVIHVGNETVETPEMVAERLRRALRYVEPERLWACTDCGMLPLSRTPRKANCARSPPGRHWLTSRFSRARPFNTTFPCRQR
jgi:5-methyltetrahydropteroyltriglutamate--homocysteine methyltransferase